MADITSPQELDPEFQAAPFIPPFPKYLQSPQEYMKANGWKPLNGELGIGYEKRRKIGMTSREEDQAFVQMMERSDRFDQERQAWVEAHSKAFVQKLGEQVNPLLRDIFAPSQPGRPAIQGAPGNAMQLAGAIRSPLDRQTLDESPLMVRPPAQPNIQSGFQPSPLTQLQMPTAGAPAIDPRPATLLGRPVQPGAEQSIQNLVSRGARASIPELNTLTSLVAPERFTEDEIRNPSTPLPASIQERKIEAQAKANEARSPFGKALADYQKLPPGQLKDLAYANIQKESAQVVGTPEYNANLKVLGVVPGHETPAQALKALEAVDARKYANERFLQALKAGDETMNIIAARIGKERGMKQATFSDLSVEDQGKATDEWMRRKGYLSSIQGAGSAAAHENVKRVAALAPAQVIMDSLDSQIQTLFTAGGPLERAIQTPGMNLGVWTQSNPQAVMYQSLAKGFLAKLARAAGEVGVLTEQDVARAEKLLPSLTPVPDTREVALGKLKQLRAMLDEISSRQVSVEGLPTMGASITHGRNVPTSSKASDLSKKSDDELLQILQGGGKKK